MRSRFIFLSTSVVHSLEWRRRRIFLPGQRLALVFWIIVGFLTIAFGEPPRVISGTVRNMSTGEPASGDEVILLRLANGMEQVGKTETDRQGKFVVNVQDSDHRHLIRAIHQKVNYDREVSSDYTTVDV